MKDAKSALLLLDQSPEFETTNAITAYWRSLLEIFIAANCDCFAISGMRSVQDLELTTARRHLLHAVDLLTHRYLDFSSNWTATTLSVRPRGQQSRARRR